MRADGNEIFFASDRNGGNRLFHAVATAGSFASGTELTEITGIDGGGKGFVDPVLSADGLTLYFCLMADGSGSWPRQVWMAQRASVNDPFGGAQAVTEVNADAIGYASPAWLSSDGCRLYVTQNRSDAAQGDLYVYERAAK